MKKYVVRIEHDCDTENPLDDCDSWKIYSFSRRHTNFRHPDEFFDNGKPQLWLRNKLRVGLAHVLSYYEHRQCSWMLANGPHPAGVEFQWDGTECAGVAVWEEPPDHMGAKTFEDRAKDCEATLDVYTDWCNGNCWWYSVEEAEYDEDDREYADRKHIDSCGGFIGEEHLAECLREEMPRDATAENTEIEGDGAWIVQYHDIFPKREVTA